MLDFTAYLIRSLLKMQCRSTFLIPSPLMKNVVYFFSILMHIMPSKVIIFPHHKQQYKDNEYRKKKEGRLMVTVARRPTGNHEAYVNKASIMMLQLKLKLQRQMPMHCFTRIQFITKLKGKVTEYFTRTI